MNPDGNAVLQPVRRHRTQFPISFLFLALIVCGLTRTFAAGEHPNIVYLLADDLGYGDVQCLNPRGKIPTPQMDRLAKEGMVFTDAHATASVCTPSRYGILTGRYNWRSRLQKAVLQGGAPPLIAADRLTVAGLLKQNGYTTACIGKWHLGMTLPDEKNWEQRIPDGPVTRGFDQFFGIAASLEMSPYGYIEKDRLVAPLDTQKQFQKHPPRMAQAGFEPIGMLPTFTRKAVEFINTQAARKQPFFLYYALTSPHAPIVPAQEWKGKSGLGDYGDFVMQTDAVVGEVLAALEKAGVTDNTLVIVTSDNGFAPLIGNKKLEKQGHYPSAQFRGYKADIWDGGHRMPFIVRWPGKVKAGTTSDALISLSDLLATCAELVGVALPANAGEDSISILPILTGQVITGRKNLIHHSDEGFFAMREGRWKLEVCPGSGGWGAPTNTEARKRGLPDVQLYDLEKDIGETTNLATEHPEIVERLTRLLEQQIAAGRSTPGPAQQNDTQVVLRKPIPAD